MRGPETTLRRSRGRGPELPMVQLGRLGRHVRQDQPLLLQQQRRFGSLADIGRDTA